MLSTVLAFYLSRYSHLPNLSVLLSVLGQLKCHHRPLECNTHVGGYAGVVASVGTEHLAALRLRDLHWINLVTFQR